MVCSVRRRSTPPSGPVASVRATNSRQFSAFAVSRWSGSGKQPRQAHRSVAGIGEDAFDEREQAPRAPVEDERRNIATLHVGRMNDDVQQDAERVDENMPFAVRGVRKFWRAIWSISFCTAYPSTKTASTSPLGKSVGASGPALSGRAPASQRIVKSQTDGQWWMARLQP